MRCRIKDETDTPGDRSTYERERSILSFIGVECSSFGAPRLSDIVPTTEFPRTENDEIVSEELFTFFDRHVGKKNTDAMEVLAGSEDVCNLTTPNDTPYAFSFLGVQTRKNGSMLWLNIIRASAQKSFIQICPHHRPNYERAGV